MSNPARRVWAVVPAAGGGTRMASAVPKQYLPLAGQSVLERTLGTLLRSGAFSGLVVVLSPDDERWPRCSLAGESGITTAVGATQRCESVRNGLIKLSGVAGNGDWVAVHDAARPCLTQRDLGNVLDAALRHDDGALLAVPVADTLKRADADNRVVETADRACLWRALTPQVFPLPRLREALDAALADGRQPTDEAQAMEWAGYRPTLVPGSATNLKITHPHDLQLAEALLQQGMES